VGTHPKDPEVSWNPRAVVRRIKSFPRRRLQVSALLSQRTLDAITLKPDELAEYPRLKAAAERAARLRPTEIVDSAAVVLSSERLSQVLVGQKIDAHEFVFRVNIAPTIGFEDAVGKRTTHRVLGRSWAYREQADEILYWCPTDANHETSTALMSELESRVAYGEVAARVISPERWFAKWQRQHFKGIPTNGFRAVSLALMSARKVFVYGVDSENQTNSARKRYFDGTERAKKELMQAMSQTDFGTVNDDYWSSLSQDYQRNDHQSFATGLEYNFYRSHPRVIVVGDESAVSPSRGNR
jgi:hypothetical protein